MNRTALFALALFACQPASDDVVIIPPATTNPTVTTAADMPAVGLDIRQVVAMQAVEIVLWDADDNLPELQVPLIRSRDALIRVLFDVSDDWTTRRVRAVLEVENPEGSEFFEAKFKVEGKSLRRDLDTTFNFTLPGDQIRAQTKFHLDIFETDPAEAPAGETLKTTWNSGAVNPVKSDKLTIVVVPVRYTYNGANLIPDTSEFQLNEYRDWMYRMYPVEDVEIQVAPEIVWNQNIPAWDVYAWSDLLDVIADMRSNASGSVDPNTYYYGLFDSKADFYDFCSNGCILGLSNLAWSANDPWYRSSIGIGYRGFQDVAATTMVHEVGHAHGRSHADCGGAQGIDPSYPYGPEAIIGSWGYDLIDETLKDPNVNHDMMGYCEPMWISDYQYYNLYLRVAVIGNAARSARIPWQTYKIGEFGAARIDKVRDFVPDLVGVPVDVELLDADGDVIQTIDGLFSPLSHGYGGTVMTDLIDDPRIVGVRVPKLETK